MTTRYEVLSDPNPSDGGRSGIYRAVAYSPDGTMRVLYKGFGGQGREKAYQIAGTAQREQDAKNLLPTDAGVESAAPNELRGLDLEWDKDVYEAVVCLELVANGGSWRSWLQHRTDTRGIVTERAGKAILKALRIVNPPQSKR